MIQYSLTAETMGAVKRMPLGAQQAMSDLLAEVRDSAASSLVHGEMSPVDRQASAFAARLLSDLCEEVERLVRERDQI